MELKTGKMKSKELAQWFGVSYNTYTHKIPKYLEMLTWYCEFEKIYGGVVINKVHLSTFKKNFKERAIKIFMQEYYRTKGLMSMTGISQTTELSIYEATKVRNELFGDKPLNVDPFNSGIIGNRERVWAIKLGENQYRYFTKEENELFDTLISKEYIGKMTPETVQKRELILKCCAEEGLSAAEYQNILTEQKLNFFNDVITKFKKLTGYQIGSPTQHMVIQDWTAPCDEYREYLYELIQKVKDGEI